jgi:hypothetical protein
VTLINLPFLKEQIIRLYKHGEPISAGFENIDV